VITGKEAGLRAESVLRESDRFTVTALVGNFVEPLQRCELMSAKSVNVRSGQKLVLA